MRAFRKISVLFILLFIVTSQAFAARPSGGIGNVKPDAKGFGGRFGLEFGSGTKVCAGGHYEMGLKKIFPGLRLAPNVELGFGSDISLLALNAEGKYTIPESITGSLPPDLKLYIGGGIGLNFTRFKSSPDAKAKHDTDISLNVPAGIEMMFSEKMKVFGEGKLVFSDDPSFRLLVGLTFIQ